LSKLNACDVCVRFIECLLRAVLNLFFFKLVENLSSFFLIGDFVRIDFFFVLHTELCVNIDMRRGKSEYRCDSSFGCVINIAMCHSNENPHFYVNTATKERRQKTRISNSYISANQFIFIHYSSWLRKLYFWCLLLLINDDWFIHVILFNYELR
jgi:hypothetical protein